MNSQKHQHEKAFRTYGSLDLNVQLCSRVTTPAKTQISQGCKLQSSHWCRSSKSWGLYHLNPIANPGLTRTLLLVDARRNSLMLHFFLVLAAGVPQVLLRTQYRVWMPADAKAHVKPQHAWSLLQICFANDSMQVKGKYNVITHRNQWTQCLACSFLYESAWRSFRWSILLDGCWSRLAAS